MAISNERQLKELLLKTLQDSMKALDKDNEKVLKDAIQDNVYNVGQPEEYERTYQLKNASTSETTILSNGGLSKVYVDYKKMTSDMYHPHAYSFGNYEPKDFTPYLVETIVEGKSGDIFGHGFWQEERDFITPATERFKKEYMTKLKTEMRKRGANVK